MLSFKLNVSDRAKAICYDHCNEWIHINCHELNDIDYENLKTSIDIWYDKLCTQEILPFCSKQANIDEKNSGYSNINTNLLNLLSQINNLFQTMIIQKMKIYPTANTKILAISLII